MSDKTRKCDVCGTKMIKIGKNTYRCKQCQTIEEFDGEKFLGNFRKNDGKNLEE